MRTLGVGIGWRPELDMTVERLPGVDFIEVVAENLNPRRIPLSLRILRGRGLPIIPHAIGLSLGGAQQVDPRRLRHLAACADQLEAPMVSDHMAFVRANEVEAGHLLPVPLTRDCLDVMVENVKMAQDSLPVPLAIENVAAIIEWPENEMSESAFLAELISRTGALLILDVENLFANWVNFGRNPLLALKELPLEQIGYVHVGGGVLLDGIWHDTHAHPVHPVVWDLLDAVAEHVRIPGALLERDASFPPTAELLRELRRIRSAIGA
jgi:uncharacterized protein (UPF0276 family)